MPNRFSESKALRGIAATALLLTALAVTGTRNINAQRQPEEADLSLTGLTGCRLRDGLHGLSDRLQATATVINRGGQTFAGDLDLRLEAGSWRIERRIADRLAPGEELTAKVVTPFLSNSSDIRGTLIRPDGSSPDNSPDNNWRRAGVKGICPKQDRRVFLPIVIVNARNGR